MGFGFSSIGLMVVSCDLEVEVNGEEIFVLDKVNSLLLASVLLVVCRCEEAVFIYLFCLLSVSKIKSCSSFVHCSLVVSCDLGFIMSQEFFFSSLFGCWDYFGIGKGKIFSWPLEIKNPPQMIPVWLRACPAFTYNSA